MFNSSASLSVPRAFIPALLISLAAICPARAQAQTQFQDTGFDTQGSTVSSYCYSCPAGPWQFNFGGAGLIHEGNLSWPAPVPESSPIVAFVQANGELEQTVTATSSGVMRITFLTAGRKDLGTIGGNQTLAITVNGTPVGTVQTVSDQSWTRYLSEPFSVTAGNTYEVRFTGQTQTDQTSFLDNVRLTTNDATTNYSYDAKGRLTKVEHQGGIEEGVTTSYSYDHASNRTTVDVSGAQ